MSSKRFAVGVSAALLATVIVARLVSTFFPRFHWEPTPGLHVHHYVYGIFILTVAGYLALRFKGPRATTWISLLYGLGVGLTFDEFGMWFNPPFVRGVRWNHDGLSAIVIVFGVIGIATLIYRFHREKRSAGLDTPLKMPL